MLNDQRLSRAARAAIGDPRNEVFVSAVSLCEIAIKVSLNKLSVPPGFEGEVQEMIAAPPFAPLSITLKPIFDTAI
jgi:PIN domain nuclease of toxin-antitoxin system